MSFTFTFTFISPTLLNQAALSWVPQHPLPADFFISGHVSAG